MLCSGNTVRKKHKRVLQQNQRVARSSSQVGTLEQSQVVIELYGTAVHINSDIFICLCNAESKVGWSICFILASCLRRHAKGRSTPYQRQGSFNAELNQPTFTKPLHSKAKIGQGCRKSQECVTVREKKAQ